jgi:hypothetical protein
MARLVKKTVSVPAAANGSVRLAVVADTHSQPHPSTGTRLAELAPDLENDRRCQSARELHPRIALINRCYPGGAYKAASSGRSRLAERHHRSRRYPTCLEISGISGRWRCLQTPAIAEPFIDPSQPASDPSGVGRPHGPISAGRQRFVLQIALARPPPRQLRVEVGRGKRPSVHYARHFILNPDIIIRPPPTDATEQEFVSTCP